ncbi:hypothetical protein HU200_046014 [Digitaria exilis]|uniref:Uncharacterized protein n=1 Tax=Digitaria exilis TaxID=1010633 RepID=A0A835B088_9POAL|nr:hypothetical protein HU200_046014 [Digitaria exilis]
MDRTDCGVICHLQCDIISVSITGLGSGGASGGELFLRCHVPAGGGRSIRIDTRGGAGQPSDGGGGTSSGGAAVSWRDVASLSCDGSPASVRELVDREAVVFEVRRRRPAVLLGRVLGSELVGRAEVPWKDAAGGSPVERRVELVGSTGRRALGEEAPAFLSARMSVRVSETTTPVTAGRRRADSPAYPHWQSGGEWSVGNEDVFAAVACAPDDAFE